VGAQYQQKSHESAGTRKMALSDVGGLFCAMIGLAENQLERNGRILRVVTEYKPPSLKLCIPAAVVRRSYSYTQRRLFCNSAT